MEAIGSKITQQQENCEDKFYLMFEWEIQIWSKVFAKKSNNAMYQDENQAEACDPYKHTKTNHF